MLSMTPISLILAFTMTSSVRLFASRYQNYLKLMSSAALKSRSHLLKLSIAHALAQSTLLAHYETIAQSVLSSPTTLAIPRQLAESGGLKLRRHEALKLTGRLFKLRRDVNLVSNVLDVPELFWSEASLKDLYDAVREYMEIKPRVQVLNEKLGVASDFVGPFSCSPATDFDNPLSSWMLFTTISTTQQWRGLLGSSFGKCILSMFSGKERLINFFTG